MGGCWSGKDKVTKAHEQQGTVGSHPLCTIDSATALGEAAGGERSTAPADPLRHPLPPAQPLPSAPAADAALASGVSSNAERSRPAGLGGPPSPHGGAPLAREDAAAPPPAQEPPRAGGLVLPPSPVAQPKLPPGWSEERHIYNLKTGVPLTGRGFVTYHSSGGSRYRTIAASWKTFHSLAVPPLNTRLRRRLLTCGRSQYGKWRASNWRTTTCGMASVSSMHAGCLLPSPSTQSGVAPVDLPMKAGNAQQQPQRQCGEAQQRPQRQCGPSSGSARRAVAAPAARRLGSTRAATVRARSGNPGGEPGLLRQRPPLPSCCLTPCPPARS